MYGIFYSDDMLYTILDSKRMYQKEGLEKLYKNCRYYKLSRICNNFYMVKVIITTKR